VIKRSNHKKRNPLRHAWRRSQGKSNKPFTPFIEVQPEDTKQKDEPKNDDTKQKETYVI
jgi:hypothetical protein